MKRPWRRWCLRCSVGSLELDCWVCGTPMVLFSEWYAHERRRARR